MNTRTDASSLTAELEALRARLRDETDNAASLRTEYECACREFVPSDEAKVFSARQRLDVALSRVEGIKVEVTTRERQIDELQGRDADDVRRRERELEFERANEQFATSQAELAKLKAEYAAFPQRIQRAEWHFNQALRTLNNAKEQMRAERR